MAAEWRIKGNERYMAKKVCDRTYEVLDEFAEEIQEGEYAYHLPSQVLTELRIRLQAELPFDPEIPSC